MSRAPRMCDRWPSTPGLCRRCKAPLSGRRTSWCSDECLEIAEVACGITTTIRRLVYARDGGVCAACGLHTDRMLDELQAGELTVNQVIARGFNGPRCICGMPSRPWCPTGRRRAARRAERGLPAGATWPHDFKWTLWEADHVVAVADGGLELGLDNVQTFCVPCHKAKTRLQAGRRAFARGNKGRHQLALWRT